MTAANLCPECKQGKTINCTREYLDGEIVTDCDTAKPSTSLADFLAEHAECCVRDGATVHLASALKEFWIPRALNPVLFTAREIERIEEALA